MGDSLSYLDNLLSKDNAHKSIRIQVLILVFTLVFLRANIMVKVVLMRETLVKTRLKVLSSPWNSGI